MNQEQRNREPSFYNEASLTDSYTIASVHVRRAIDEHGEWIESRLGVTLSETVILHTAIEFRNAAVSRFLRYAGPHAPVPVALARLSEQIESVEAPESVVPVISLARNRAVAAAKEPLTEESCAYSIEWLGGPVLLRLRDVPFPMVTLNVRYHAGPESSAESEQDILLIPKHGLEPLIALLKAITKCDGKPKLKIGYEEQAVIPCDWDELTLDPSVASLLKEDFEVFFEREAWFRRMRLPFRRGYLLHGPPGNGKTTAIRAMLTSRSLTAHSMRFFDKNADDDDLDRMFQRAADNAPSVVVLEDIDRVFPRTGQSKTQISLQALLNCLDGLTSAEGTITIATANEPTALDPAILRRSGRFDRVILFPNPSRELRCQYFTKIDPRMGGWNLEVVIKETEGMSFAQLREAHIMAAQGAYLEAREIVTNDLLDAVWKLRRSLLSSNLRSDGTGFAKLHASERARQ